MDGGFTEGFISARPIGSETSCTEAFGYPKMAAAESMLHFRHMEKVKFYSLDCAMSRVARGGCDQDGTWNNSKEQVLVPSLRLLYLDFAIFDAVLVSYYITYTAPLSTFMRNVHHHQSSVEA